MFEKEAEEYAKVKEIERNNLECITVVNHEVSRAFKDGAEFGYNKANEWHYIKDGILPKENKNVLIYSNRANYIGFYRNGFWFTNDDGCLEDDGIEVVAWKEIVLPEVPKESE